ncbi:MAG: sugar ABC transporter permease, partial [Faecousia sp.]
MKVRKLGSKVLHNVFIAILCFIWLIPIVWLVATSFSAYSGMNTSTFFPAQWSVEHYLKLFRSDSVNQFPQWFLNTFKIACFTCIISTAFVLMVAYATSFKNFKSRKTLMNLAVMLNLFPGVLTMIAVYFVLKTFGLTNSHIGLILVYSGSAGLGYLICKGFFDTVPRSLCEAARLDGCSEARIFFQIIIPMSRPIIVYTVISSFLTPWMDFVYSKMILNAGVSEYYTVAVG